MFRLGSFKGETRSELMNNIVNGIGLGLTSDNDKNIGRKVKFKNPRCEDEKRIYTIVGRQKAWGYDENGNYTMIPAYRGIAEGEDNFGRPLHLYEVDFID